MQQLLKKMKIYSTDLNIIIKIVNLFPKKTILSSCHIQIKKNKMDIKSMLVNPNKKLEKLENNVKFLL
jgi:hypothetical protein